MFKISQKPRSLPSHLRSLFLKSLTKINPSCPINSLWLLSLLQFITIISYLAINLKQIKKHENSSLRCKSFSIKDLTYSLPSRLLQQQYLQPVYFYCGIGIIMKIFIGIVVGVMYNNRNTEILGRIVGIGRIIGYYMVTVLGDIVGYAVKEVGQGEKYLVLYWYFLALSLVWFCVVYMVIRLQIYPFRSFSSFWCIDNMSNLQNWMATFARSLQISIFGPSLSINLIGIILYFYSNKYSKGYLNSKMNPFSMNLIDFICIIDVVFILVQLGISQQILLILLPLMFIIFFIKKAINIYLKSIQIIYLPSCKSLPQQFYNFYYQSIQKYKNTPITENKQLNMIHYKNCDQNCQINKEYNLSQRSNNYKIVTNILENNKDLSNKHLILFQLWKVQNKIITNLQCFKKRQLSLEEQFIIICMQQFILEQRNSQNISENIAQLKDNNKSDYFLQQLSYFIDIYLKCYEQLLKPIPCIDEITLNGIQIIKRMSKIQSIYRQLHSSNNIGYQMKVLYYQTCQIMNRNQPQNPKLQQNKIDLQYQNISSCSIPTFEIDKDNGSIIDVNCEGSKLIRLSKKQLRFKKIVQFLYPQVQFQEIIVAKSRKNIFIYVKNITKTQYQFCRLQISMKTIENKPRIILQFCRIPQKPTQNKILINLQFQPLYMKKQSILLGIQTDFYPSQWQQIFQNYIYPKRQQISKRQCLKFQLPQTGIQLLIRKLQTIRSNQNVLHIKVYGTGYEQRKELMKSSYQTIKQSRKMENSSNSFSFFYQDFDNRLRIVGSREPSSLCLIHSMKIKSDIILSSFSEQAIYPSFQLEQQIFTYRLWNGEIYNVDLEDKQGYQNLFDGRPQKKENSFFDNDKMGKIFIGIIVIIFIIILGIQIAFILKINSLQAQILEGLQQMQMLNVFNIDFSRLIAILRDWANNLKQNYPQIDFIQLLKTSKQNIQSYINGTLIFDNTIQKMSFQIYNFQGSITQLARVILSQMDRFISQQNDEIIQSIHNSFIIELNPIMEQYQSQKQKELKQNIQMSIDLLGYFSYGNILLIIVGMFVFFMYVRTLIKNNYDTIQPLMKIKPNIFELNKQNAQKLKYKIQLMKKKIQTQITLQNIYKQNSNNNFARKIELSKSITNILIILIIVPLIIYIMAILGGKSSFDDVFINISNRSQAQKVLTQIYPKFCSLTNSIEHLQYMNITKVEQIYTMLKSIRQTAIQPLFSQNLNNLIYFIYFSNSCQQLANNGLILSSCSHLFQGFTIQNPFQIGLLNFYHRQAVYIRTNITQSFAFTGILSQSFVEVYNLISEKINQQLMQYISDMHYVPFVYVLSITVLTFVQIFIFWKISTFFKKQTRKIIEVTSFLSISTQNEIKPQITITDKKQTQIPQISKSQLSLKQATSVRQIMITKRRGRPT